MKEGLRRLNHIQLEARPIQRLGELLHRLHNRSYVKVGESNKTD